MFDMPRSADATFDSFLGVGSDSTGALTSPDNVNPVFTLSPNEGYNQGYVQGPPKLITPTEADRTPQVLNGTNVPYEAQSIPTQYVQEMFLNIERQLPGGLMLSAAYVNTKGTHQGFQRDLNQVPEALLGPGNAQNLRPYPQFESIGAGIGMGT